MITEIEDYFARGCGRCGRFDTPDCSTVTWGAGLSRLRAICRDAGLIETLKWAHPCYMHHGRNIAIIGAFRGDFRLTFFNAALMQDPDGVLERQGEQTRAPDMIRFVADGDVSRLEPTIRAYLQEAMQYAEAGLRPKVDRVERAIPAELAEALDRDPELAQAFDALTPGRRRSYVMNLAAAKKSETRIARIAKFRARILAGKGALER